MLAQNVPSIHSPMHANSAIMNLPVEPRNTDQLGTTVRPPSLVPIGDTTPSKKLSQMQGNLSPGKHSNLQFKAIDVEVAEQPPS